MHGIDQKNLYKRSSELPQTYITMTWIITDSVLDFLFSRFELLFGENMLYEYIPGLLLFQLHAFLCCQF